MSYFLIIFIIALALAPLAHFMPSKRQREIARMREYAAVRGLFVEFRNNPGAGERAGRSAGDIIYYGIRLPPRRGDPVENGSWVLGQEGWRSLGGRVPIPVPLLELPVDIIAASVDQSSCGIYWREAAGEERVEQIRRVLERWSRELLS